MTRTKSVEPIKDCTVGLRCSVGDKVLLESMAAARDMTVSHFLWRLIESILSIERERRKRLPTC